MMKAFGADCRLVKEGGMSGCIKEAEELHKQYPNSFIPAQFDNENNALAHYKTTGPEIYKQTEGELDIFVTSFGTGGTLTGISRYLKEQNKEIKTIGVDPASSAFVSKGEKGAHKIQGIGAGFKPSILDLNYVDEVMTIQDEEAYQVTRELAQVEGLFVGISAGCNVAAAIKVAKENPNKVIVTVLPDNGERYLSVEGLFE
jgi:cysteine synthase A